MFNDGGRMKDIFCGNPTCPHCGVTYPIMETHNCPFSQEAKIQKLREEIEALEMKKKTLRDQFAMAALTGILANLQTASLLISLGHGGDEKLGESASKAAYAIADDMLVYR